MNETERFAQSRQALRRPAGRTESPTTGQESADMVGSTRRVIEPQAAPSAPKPVGSLVNTPTVPIEDQIRLRAYERYLERQGQPGCPETDWVEAEREVRSTMWAAKNHAL